MPLETKPHTSFRYSIYNRCSVVARVLLISLIFVPEDVSAYLDRLKSRNGSKCERLFSSRGWVSFLTDGEHQLGFLIDKPGDIEWTPTNDRRTHVLAVRLQLGAP